jgi:hypothetical protein
VLPVTYTLVDSDAMTAGLTPAMAALTSALNRTLAAHAAGHCNVPLRVALDRKRFGGAAAVPVNTKYQVGVGVCGPSSSYVSYRNGADLTQSSWALSSVVLLFLSGQRTFFL